MEARWFGLVQTNDCGYLVPTLMNPAVLAGILDVDSKFRRTMLVEVSGGTWREFHPCTLRCPGARENTLVVLLARTCKRVFNYVQNFMNPCQLSFKTRQVTFISHNRVECEEDRRRIPISKPKVINLVSDSEESDSDEEMEEVPQEPQQVQELLETPPPVENVVEDVLFTDYFEQNYYAGFHPSDVFLLQ